MAREPLACLARSEKSGRRIFFIFFPLFFWPFHFFVPLTSFLALFFGAVVDLSRLFLFSGRSSSGFCRPLRRKRHEVMKCVSTKSPVCNCCIFAVFLLCAACRALCAGVLAAVAHSRKQLPRCLLPKQGDGRYVLDWRCRDVMVCFFFFLFVSQKRSGILGKDWI